MLGVDLSNNVCNNERVENKQESEQHYDRTRKIYQKNF